MMIKAATAILALTACTHVGARTIYVSPHGKASAPTASSPAPVQTAVDALEPGDTCVFLEGTYRQSVEINVSGTPEKPIQIVGRGDVLFDGTDPISSPWTRHGAFYRIPLPGPAVEQVFENAIPLTQARWPNARFFDTWIRSKWANSGEGSKKDLMICDALAETGIDWTGAMAVLNVGHQYKTWTRTVLTHEKGARQFTYDLSERLGDGKDDGRTWWDDRFYLTGTIKALDAPGEWFHDADAGYLYLIPHGNAAPRPGSIAVKRRDYGILGKGVRHLHLSGFRFHGCTVRFDDADSVTIEGCRIRFPAFTTEIGETLPAGQRRETPRTGISGKDNTIRGILVAYASGIGIAASGRNNRIEDCIVHDVAWSGTINFPAIALNSDGGDSGMGSTVTRCEVFNAGNIGILYRGPSNVIQWNHVHHTGLACRDIAAIHTGSPNTRGSIAHHNWVHHSMGKAIRGDDQTRGLTVHHNLVWACDEGIIVKGDDNMVYHNSILGIDGHGALMIPTRQEPEKWWTRHEILPIQNLHSRFFNNYSEAVVYRYDPIPQNVGITHNFVSDSEGKSPETTLVEINPMALETGEFDPRPRPNAFLVDAGAIVEGLTDDYNGAAPDAGAYEHGEPMWRPGPTWTAPEDLVLEIEAEVARSHALTHPAARQSIPLPEKLRRSDLSEASIEKLQVLYDTCWTDEELKRRGMAIRSRQRYPESTPGYRDHHAIVVELHRTATRRLLEKAPTVLSQSDLERFLRLMSPAKRSEKRP
jgi:hypothetical protein